MKKTGKVQLTYKYLQIYLIACLLSIAACIQLNAQSIKFKARVNKNVVATGERFQISYELNTNGSGFTPPSFENFRPLSGPNQSSSMQWVNGQTSSSVTYSYILLPVKEGQYTLEGASIKANGKTYTSNPITITVKKGAAVSSSNQNRANNSNANNKKTTASKADPANNLMVKLFVDKRNVYQGEQIVATYKIYTRLDIVDYDFSILPSFNGFYTEDIELPRQTLKREVLNGIPYNVATLKKTILFPQRSGNLTIDAMGMDITVRIQDKSGGGRRSVFDQFFGRYKDVKYSIKSNSIPIKVKALPSAGKPADFSGEVGNFNFSVTLDKHTVKTNEAINLKATLSGKGNIKLLDKLTINFPPDFEVYDPKITDKISANGSGMSGKRTFEYLIIPRHSGDFTIDPINFSYFDVKKKKYMTLSSGELKIKVEKGAEEETVSYNNTVNKESVKFLGKDIRFIKSGPTNIKARDSFFFDTFWYYVLLITPLLLIPIVIAVRKGRAEYNGDIVRVKSRKANKVAVKRLSTAKKMLDQQNNTQFYEEIFKALYGYLGDKLNIAVADLNKEIIAQKLQDRNLDSTITSNLIDTINHCEMARFSPSSELSTHEIYDKTSELIGTIEKQLKA